MRTYIYIYIYDDDDGDDDDGDDDDDDDDDDDGIYIYICMFIYLFYTYLSLSPQGKAFPPQCPAAAAFAPHNWSVPSGESRDIQQYVGNCCKSHWNQLEPPWTPNS